MFTRVYHKNNIIMDLNMINQLRLILKIKKKNASIFIININIFLYTF